MATRRAGTAAAPATSKKVGGSVAFGEDSLYSGGFVLPVGNWCLLLDVRLHKNEKSKYDARVGVMGTCHNLDNPTSEPFMFFWDMGTKAHQSFLPSEDGMGLDPIPGAPAQTMGDQSRWGLLRKSLKDSGLPKGVFIDSVKPLTGMWVHIEHMPEPDGWKEARGKDLGEGEAKSSTTVIPIVTEFLADGKPWEGGGGWPATGYKAGGSAPAARRVAPAAQAVAAAVEEEEVPADDGGEQVSLADAIIDTMGNVLLANPQGMNSTKLKVDTITELREKYSEEDAAEAVQLFQKDSTALAGFAAQCGFKIVGTAVKRA